jgi:hypothetical protein
MSTTGGAINAISTVGHNFLRFSIGVSFCSLKFSLSLPLWLGSVAFEKAGLELKAAESAPHTKKASDGHIGGLLEV